jgi:hypothetical protein
MPIGKNILPAGDKLIKKTTSIKSKGSKGNKASNTNIKSAFGMPSSDPNKNTYKTKKMTFYVKADLLERLYNFSYWDRRSVTEVFNTVLRDGLKGKNTKPKP